MPGLRKPLRILSGRALKLFSDGISALLGGLESTVAETFSPSGPNSLFKSGVQKKREQDDVRGMRPGDASNPWPLPAMGSLPCPN